MSALRKFSSHHDVRAANDNYVYDASGALRIVDNLTTNTLTEYIPGAGGKTLARVDKSGGVDDITYMHSDHLGSSSVGTNGTIKWTEHYTPFGMTLLNPTELDNQAGFTGHIKDKATGLNYMQARYYDPVGSRFLSIDPVTFMDTGNPAHFNRYAYSYNDPINMLDNDGRKPEHVQDRVSQGIRAARQNPQSGIRVAAGAVAMSAAAAGTGAAAVTAAPAAAAACTATCATVAVGASAGTLVEGANQLEKGEFSAGKLAASAAVGAAGGAGSLTGKTIAGQMAGAAISAGLAGSTVEMLNQGANGTVDGVGVVAAGAKAAVGAALGAGAGNLAGRALTGASGFGGAGNLSTGGAALGASIGEAGSATTMDVIDDRIEDF